MFGHDSWLGLHSSFHPSKPVWSLFIFFPLAFVGNVVLSTLPKSLALTQTCRFPTGSPKTVSAATFSLRLLLLADDIRFAGPSMASWMNIIVICLATLACGHAISTSVSLPTAGMLFHASSNSSRFHVIAPRKFDYTAATNLRELTSCRARKTLG